MSKAYISPYKGLDDGKAAAIDSNRTAQCFQGDCSADSVELDVTDSYPGSAQFTVPAGTSYIAVYLTLPGQIYAGPDAASKEERGAYFPAGWWPMSVQTGDVVFVRDL